MWGWMTVASMNRFSMSASMWWYLTQRRVRLRFKTKIELTPTVTPESPHVWGFDVWWIAHFAKVGRDRDTPILPCVATRAFNWWPTDKMIVSLYIFPFLGIPQCHHVYQIAEYSLGNLSQRPTTSAGWKIVFTLDVFAFNWLTLARAHYSLTEPFTATLLFSVNVYVCIYVNHVSTVCVKRICVCRVPMSPCSCCSTHFLYQGCLPSLLCPSIFSVIFAYYVQELLPSGPFLTCLLR